MRVVRLGLLFVTALLTSRGLLSGMDWAKKKYREMKTKPSEIKFVRHTNKICKTHIFSKTVCSDEIRKIDSTFECSYAIVMWMVEFFDSTMRTLDIAIYLVTCEAISDAILRAHRRGVKVRIITDFIMAKGSGSAIGKFMKSGIPVSMLEQSRMMHRKSAISDNSRLFMGTGNWTMQALAGNWDLWYQTSDPIVVEAFMEEFEHQWARDEAMKQYSESLALPNKEPPGFFASLFSKK